MVRVTGTGEPVAFEMLNPRGSLNHLFTQPAHRSKGLGSAVEKAICVKLIKKGIIPAKNVESYNVNVVKSTDKNPYWTRRDDSEGNPIMMEFLKVSKNEAPVLGS